MRYHKGHRFRQWRTKLHNDQLASQVSSILLQRHNWSHLLQNLDLSSKLTSPLFLQILRNTQTNPHVSLQFFHWTKANLGFEPDLRSSSHLIRISLGCGSIPPSSILDRLVQSYPSSALFDSMVEACHGSDSQSQCLSFVVEGYGKKGLFREGLQVFDKMRVHGFSPSISACNELLDVMHRENEIRTAWSFYGAMIRNGLLPNRFTWQLVARILGKSEKPERVGMILDRQGIYSSEIYETLVDCLSKNGNFVGAFDRLNDMRDRNIDLGFSTLSSILDGACRHQNSEFIDRTINIMIEKELISKGPLFEYDKLIEKLCGIGKSYAAEMFFRKALKEKIVLRDKTYGNMLRALSVQGRRDDAVWIYRLIAEKGVTLDDTTCVAFSRVVLKEEQCDEVADLLMDIIRKGFSLGAPELSRFLTVLCRKRKWREAEEMLYVILDRGLLPDSFCCTSLVEHYCYSGQLDSAMALHDKMEKLDVSLDVTTYNVLLNGLVGSRRVREAVRVFDHMRRHERLSSEGFVVLIRGLSRVNELKSAMKLHDEMLKVGLKPDLSTYKRLILAFK